MHVYHVHPKKQKLQSSTHFAEAQLKVAELQALLQLDAVSLPEVFKGRCRFIQLTQESGEGKID